ncbi:hypothetical protein TWF106_009167 [Orbilia oligospora]|uniref:Phosphoglycerate mutase-like protein n=3 Tax=Orbilia oligospora TaxID=2813651 RepID=A0A6G1LYY9_ORBOL|nr:hypothetical protein TWF106_009167 [Orbilia oligospora]KAF3238921.1 hypothetical protein TWF192_010198 [Orbilia oligospora]
MGRPRLIILIRHAQSEGNQNKAIHQTIPDHRVKLTQFGHEQARAAGHRLKDILLPTDTLQIYTSPYRRTRETTANIVESLGDDWKEKTTVYEEPRIREQGELLVAIPFAIKGMGGMLTFCLEISKDVRHIKREYGRKELLTVTFSTESLMANRLQMHYTVEEFEDWMNVEHCQFVIMRRNEKGKYDLETKLRTWTEYDRQQAEAAKNDPNLAAQRAAKQKKFQSLKRKWGGCPDGCMHGAQMAGYQPAATAAHQHPHSHHQQSIAAVIDQHDKGAIEKAIAGNLCSNCGHEVSRSKSSKKVSRPVVRVEPPSAIDTSSDEEGRTSSDGKLHSSVIRGRDGGGSKSGFNSDYEAEDEIDSEREKQEVHEENFKMLHAKTEKLGDIKSDSEWSRGSQADSEGGGNGPVHGKGKGVSKA